MRFAFQCLFSGIDEVSKVWGFKPHREPRNHALYISAKVRVWYMHTTFRPTSKRYEVKPMLFNFGFVITNSRIVLRFNDVR